MTEGSTLDRLRQLECVCRSNVVYSELIELRIFNVEDYLDTDDDEFKKWRNSQWRYIEVHKE